MTKKWLKVISLLILPCFTALQFSFAEEYQLTTQPLTPEKSIQEGSDTHISSISAPPSINSIDFLQNDLSLSPPTSENSSPLIEEGNIYDYERYDFEAAFDLLRPEYASAVIVKELKEEDLKSLLDLDFEVAVAVLDQEIVLFSSGNRHEILLNKPAEDIIEEAGFMAHTHPFDFHDAGPSAADFEHAGENLEYVISEEGVYAYTNQGGVETLSYSEFLNRLNEAQDKSKAAGQNSTQAREILNAFIKEMDLANQAFESESSLFRSTSVSAFSDNFNRASLGTDWTVVKASFGVDGQALSHNCCTAPGGLVLNMPLSSNDYSLQMDTFYTDAMAARGLVARYQDLNNYYYAKVGRDGDARIIKVAGGVATQLGLHDGPWFNPNTWHRLEFAVQGSSLSFYVDGQLRLSVQDAAFTIGQAGIFSDGYYTRFDNFSMTVPGATPVLTPPSINSIPAFTNQTVLTFSGTKPPNTSVWINGTERVPANPSTVWSYVVTLSGEIQHTFSITTKNSQNQESAPITLSTTLDQTLPIMSAVTPMTVTNNSATIAWVTNEISDTVIEYGTSAPLGANTYSTSLVTNHSWTVRNLAAGTTYYYRAKSKDRAGNAVYSAVSTFKTLSAAEIAQSFQEIGGLLAMEGENYHERIARNNKTWDTWASVSDFSGSGYPFATPDTGVSQNTDFTTMSPELKYKINIQSTGTYYIWIRGLAWNSSSDMIHVGLDGQALAASDRIKFSSYGAFTWTKDTFDNIRATIDIAAAGEHTLNIWMGDDGFFLDKILLTQDPNFAPTGYGPSESGRSGSAIVTVALPTVNALPQFTNQSTVTLSGTKAANTSIWVNGIERVANDSSTTWSYTETLSGDGLKTFSILAKNAQGNQSSAVSVSTTRDTAAPQISFTSGQLTNNANYLLTYTVDGANQQEDRTLTEGQNAVSITRTDLAGNSATANYLVTLDTIPPDIVFTSAQLTNNANYTLTYTVDGVSTQDNRTLSEGQNTLSVTKTDLAGNSTTKTFAVTLDIVAPNIVFTSTQLTNNGNYTLTYTVDGVGQQETRTLTQQGQNVLSVTKTDLAGNSATQTHAVTLDSVAPAISNVTTSGLSSNSATITWTTNEVSDTQIEYGPTISYGSNTAPNISFVTNHSQSLSNLQANTLYHYRVKSRDQAGNIQVSSDMTFTTQALPAVEPGLRGYWNFDSISGTATSDLSGNGNTGTLVNGAIQSTDHPPVNFSNAGSLNFDGVNDYVSLGTSAVLFNSAQPATISLWTKLDAYTLPYPGPITLKTDQSTGFEIFYSNSGNYRGINFGSSSNFVRLSTIADPTMFGWHHVIVVYNGVSRTSPSSYRLYLDGALQSLFDPGGFSTVPNVNRIGQASTTQTYFDGNIDEVRIYNRALSQAEVQNLARGNLPDYTPPVISAVSVADVTPQAATIRWTTNESSDSQIEYGTTASYGFATALNSLLITDHSETLSGLQAGTAYHYRIKSRDALGNLQISGDFTFTTQTASGPLVLQDGTTFFYEGNVLIRELTPDRHEVFYRSDGSVEHFRYSDGREIMYRVSAQNVIEIYDALGSLIETIDQPQPITLDEAQALKLTLEGGIEAFYVNGELVEFKTQAGIRITDFTFNAANEIKDALIVHPDGTREIIRDDALLRRIHRDGSILDFTPKGFSVREIAQGAPQYFQFEKLSQNEIQSTRIFSPNGSFSLYDELGILREVESSDGAHFSYDRSRNGDFYITTLNRVLSSAPQAKSLIEAHYTQTGVLTEMKFQDGTKIFLDQGRIASILDSAGSPIEDFSYLDGLTVTRSGTQFIYDASGFLKAVVTAGGTISRVAADSDGDGELSDEEIVEILLETVEGNRLRDFELDANGNIIRGIIETREGIKQRIENGVLTGFETVDGKVYDFLNNEAVLREWRFRDGTRVVYDGGLISEILFPDQKRLHTLGFNQEKQIQSFVEETSDGTQRFFENGKLVKLVTSEGIEIYYSSNGFAERVVLADRSEERITYMVRHCEAANQSGAEAISNGDCFVVPSGTPRNDDEIVEIVFEGSNSSRTFSPDGTLLFLLTTGTGAEYTNGQVSRLFTRFGEIQNPSFNPIGILSGEILLVNGAKLIVTDGTLVQAVKPNGTKVNYTNGRITSVETASKIYQINYTEDSSGKITNLQLSVNSQGNISTHPLVLYLLDNPDPELAEILLPRPLYNSLDDPSDVQSGLDIGQDIFFAKIVEDVVRGQAYEFGSAFFPEWLGVSLSGSQGYLSQMNGLNLNSTLIDIDGDGLSDRVYMETASANYWRVQLNNGSGFDDPIIWNGVDPNFYQGALEYYDGQPNILAMLIDLNGDGFPDRLANRSGESIWQVQLDNGIGFDNAVGWGNIQLLPSASTAANYALKVFEGKGITADLIDLDGDGLPDRVLRPSVEPFNHWFWQKNTGNAFADAVLWSGVDTSFNSDPKISASLDWYTEIVNNYSTPEADAIYQAMAAAAQATQNYQLAQHNICIYGTRDQINACIRNYYIAMQQAQNALQSAIAPYGGSASYVATLLQTGYAILNDLVDLDGDKLPDRLLLRSKTGDPTGEQEWWWQRNNGTGFKTPVLWAGSVRQLPNAPTAQAGSSIRYTPAWVGSRNMTIDLRDVTGDGLPDRISVDHHDKFDAVYTSWWVEVNNGAGFEPAVRWDGIYGTTAEQTVIAQDLDHFRTAQWGGPALYTERHTDLVDINGDEISDRVIFNQAQSKWLVQYGTGSGFLPVQEMQIESIQAPANQINTSRYGYLHVSLKSETDIPSSMGEVRVILSEAKDLGDPSSPSAPQDDDIVQEWTVSNLTTDWQDFFLPIDQSKPNAGEVKIQFVPSGTDPEVPVYVDNVTFVAARPPDPKDWLNYLLAEENILSEIHSDRNQTLANFLLSPHALGGDPNSGFPTNTFGNDAVFDWQRLLNAETRINFDPAGEAAEFETFYGSVSQVQNGRVVETVLPNGNRIQFDALENNALNQTITINGSVQTIQLSYGRVREVSRPGKSPLQYSYEYVPESSPSFGDDNLVEITVVFDPDTNVREKYRDKRLISRLETNGIETRFTYSSNGELTQSDIVYKGRVRQTFYHSVSSSGNKVLTTEEGIAEEYSSAGTILFHTTPEGYRYAHTFEQARRVVAATQTEIVNFPDGTSFTVDYPIMTLEDDGEAVPEGENVHRVSLVSFTAQTGEYAEYEGSQLKNLLLSGGVRISFDRTEIEEVFNPETGETSREIKLLDAVVFHPDGTITEFKNGLPFSITSAAGRVISIVPDVILSVSEGSAAAQNDIPALINSSESAQFHYAQALKLWNELVNPKWNSFQAPPTLPIQIEYDMAGKLVTRQFQEGIVELYEEGKIQNILAPDGEVLVSYTYDGEGNPVQILMGAGRRRLNSAILKLRAEVAVENQKALALVAEREQVINQTIEAQYIIARDRLLAIRAQIEAERNKVTSIKAKGKKAKGVISDGLAQVQVAIDQVNQAIARLAEERSQALSQLHAKVFEAKNQIQAETNRAYGEIQAEGDKAKRSILKEELSPIVYHWYRKILGRDPSQAEYSVVIDQMNYDDTVPAGETGGGNVAIIPAWLEDLKATLLSSSELSARQTEVSAIKARVQTELLSYLTMSDAEKLIFAQSLGMKSPVILSASEGSTSADSSQPSAAQNDILINLSQTEVQAVLDWLNARSLHFGQSAYFALEALLNDAGIAYDRINLASNLILIDILTGTITPLEGDDLVISLYALRRVAARYGLTAHSLALTYDALKAVFEDACPDPGVACAFRLIAHINGDHYVILTKVTAEEVIYIDPGAGPLPADASVAGENALNQVTLTKEEFLKTWLDPKHPQDGFGYVLSPRPPPGSSAVYRVLTASQEQSIRGAFFGFLIPVFIAIAVAVKTAVAAAIAAVTGLVSGLVSGIGSIVSSFGSFFAGLFSGNFLAGIQGLFGGILTGLGQIGGAFASVFTAVHAGLLLTIQGVYQIGVALSNFVLSFAFSGALKFGLVGLTFQGTGKLLDAIGVSPKITQTLISGGKLVAGIGLLATGNPIGIAGALGLVGSGTAELLNLHASLSPAITNLISAGASALGAFAGGVIDTGTLAGAVAGLKTALPFLSLDLAQAGLAGAGNALGLDWRITSLIGLPISASISGLVGGIANGSGPGSIFNSIKDALTNGQTLGGLVSVGASIGLDALGLPPVATSFISNFLGSMASGLSGGSSGGGGPGDIETQGKGVLSKIGEGIRKFGSSLVNAVGSVISFGAKVIEGVGNFTVQGFKKAIGTFSSIFSRQTQENIYADETGLSSGTVTQNGDTWTWQNGSSRIDYNTVTGEAVETFGLGGQARVTGLSQDGSGNIYYQRITYENVINGTATLTQSYENGRLTGWTYGIDGVPIITVRGPQDLSGGPWMTDDGWIEEGDIVIQIPGPEEENPNPDPRSIFSLFESLVFAATIKKGQVENATVELKTIPGTQGTQTANETTDLVLLNGFEPELRDTSPVILPEYFLQNNPFRQKLNGLGLSENQIKTVRLFGSPLLVDVFNWFNEIGLTTEIKAAFNLIQKQNASHPFVALALSGAAGPLVAALSDPTFGVKTAILVGGPVRSEWTNFTNSSLERIINVYGSEDVFLERNRTSLIDILNSPTNIGQWIDESLIPTIQESYTHSQKSFDTINIELLGLGHEDYFYSNSDGDVGTLREKSSDFIAFLTKAALTKVDLEDFLLDLKARGFATFTEETVLDVNTGIQHRVRTYVMDLEKWSG